MKANIQIFTGKRSIYK